MTETAANPAPPSRKTLLWGSLAAVAVAAVAVVGFVLPAEYGIDPTGIGKALGLTKLAEPAENIYLARGKKRTNTLFALPTTDKPDAATLDRVLAANKLAMPAGAEVKTDRFTFELAPYEGIELKYVLAQGAPMIFAWTASKQVNVDMHAHPFQGGTDLTESYVIADLPGQTAAYVAPFTGIHGWYWQNRTLEPVTLTLNAAGAFTGSKIFDPAGEHDRALTPPASE